MTRLWPAICAIVLAAGCASTTFVPVTYYVVEPEFTVDTVQSRGETIGLRPLNDVQSQRRDMAYLDADRALRSYPNVQWAENAGTFVTRAILSALAQTGRYTDVGDTADLGARPDVQVVGELRRFTEVRGDDGPAAVCEIHLEARTIGGDASAWDFRAEEPMNESSPSELAAAMEKAVGAVASQAANALAGLTVSAAQP